MPIIKRILWECICDACGYSPSLSSIGFRTNEADLPRNWGRTGDYIRCASCERDYQETITAVDTIHVRD